MKNTIQLILMGLLLIIASPIIILGLIIAVAHQAYRILFNEIELQKQINAILKEKRSNDDN